MPKASSIRVQQYFLYLNLIILLSLFLNPQVVRAASFTVTNSFDSGSGSLREAIGFANSTAGADIIDFDAAAAPYNIALLSAIVLSDNSGVMLDGWSVGGGGYAGPPLVAITGAGIVVSSSNNTVRGFVFNQMVTATAITISGAAATNNWIYGNYIGTNTAGSVQVQNGEDGIRILNGSTNNLIGTNSDGVNDTAERNLIAGNRMYGLRIQASDNNRVAGNYFGTDITGTIAICNGCTGLQNGGDGLLLELAASSNIIGTNGDGLNDEVEGNVISGTVSSNNGIFIRDAGTDDNRVAGNLIGTNAAGTSILANGGGISIAYGAQNNIIGTNGDGISDDLERNIISGNSNHGVQILENGTDKNTIAGNYIGIDITGTAILSNGTRGLEINTGPAAGGPSGNIIGNNNDGSAGEANERNIISGNTGPGVIIFGTGTDANVVSGNFIGTNAAGTAALRNTSAGVHIFSGATNTEIQGTASVASLISGNILQGIIIADSATTGTLVNLNFIGTDLTGTLAIPNQRDGVLVNLAGTSTINSNTIRNNRENGILITGSSPSLNGNMLATNRSSGVYVQASYGASSSPATAADDSISLPSIIGSTIDNNCVAGVTNCAGIFLIDSTVSNRASLELDNSIGTNNSTNDIEQRWYGALEIISSGLPIASTALIDSSAGGPSYNMSSTANCIGLLNNTIIHSTTAPSCTNVLTWTVFTEFIVNPAGSRLNYSPQSIANPVTNYSFDANAATNPTNTGAGFNAEGIATGSLSRYQVMESISPDPLPTVISTSPIDSATGVAVNTTIDINFSEDVTVTGSWFTIICTVSGLHPASVSGGVQNYTLSPSISFIAGESCTVTIAASQVADQDNPIGNMAADYVFNFDIADAPPVVSLTTPDNGTSNNAVNTNISISFSEVVTVTGAWFDISCSLSGTYTAVVTGTSPGANFQLNPNVDFSFGETCTVILSAADITDNDLPIANMAADYSFTFGIADTPPFVASTSPIDGATGVAIDTDIVIDFSESVSLTGVWYSINCSLSGNHLATESGTGASFTLDMTSDFAYSELCTVNIIAAQVQDLDAPAETMLADYSFSFTTLDEPPFVASTSPIDSATGIDIDMNIGIDFSEDITLIGTWFTINCTTTGSHTGLVTGGPQNYSIDPNTDFVAGEICTVIIVASQVLDQDGTLSSMTTDYQFSFSTVFNAAYASAPLAAGGNIDFGNVLLGQSSTFLLTITEVGQADLDLTAINISNPAFTVSSTSAFPTTIVDESGSSVLLTLNCSPLGTGAISATMTVNHNAVGGVATYTLSCNGIVPSATAMPPLSLSGSPLEPASAIFDPALSKIGYLQAGELGLRGQLIEWVITVSNPGAVVGANIIFSDTLRPELKIERVETSKGTSTVSGQTVTVSIGNLLPQETVQISLFTRVLDGEEIDNTACVIADNLNGERCVTGLMVRSLPATGENKLNPLLWGAALLFVIILWLGLRDLKQNFGV